MMIALGGILSLLHSRLFKQAPHLSRIVTCIITFSNMGNIPLVLMKGICSPYGPLNNDVYCDEVNSYIALQMLTYHIILWSYGYTLIQLGKEESNIHIIVNESDLDYDIDELKNQKEHPKTSLWNNLAKNLMLPAPLACIAGLVAGLMPGLKEIFYNKNLTLYVVVDSWINISFGGVVIAQMSLGANLIILSDRDGCLTK